MSEPEQAKTGANAGAVEGSKRAGKAGDRAVYEPIRVMVTGIRLNRPRFLRGRKAIPCEALLTRVLVSVFPNPSNSC